MNLPGSSKVRKNLIRLAVLLLLVVVVKSMSDHKAPHSKKASFFRKFFSPIRDVVHKSEAESKGEKEAPSGDKKSSKASKEHVKESSKKESKGGEKKEKKGGKSVKKEASKEEESATAAASGAVADAAAALGAGAAAAAQLPIAPAAKTTASTGKGLLPQGPITLPPGSPVFDVTQSGAKGDGQPNIEEGGECLNAIAFIQTWKKACETTGPAKVLIPKGDFVVGQVLFVGPCKSSPIMVENNGNLLANPDLSLYPSAEWILFENVQDVIFTGAGLVNGNGPKNWEKSTCKHNTGHSSCSPLPTSIKLHRANNSIVDGIKSVDPMFFHMFVTVCSNVTVRGATLQAPDSSPNTDGIHTSRASDVTIYDSIIATGDDCISIGQGSININAFNVMCGPGHGISVGSLGREDEEMDVKGIHIRNCTLKGTDNGARIKTWQGKVDTVADDISYEDIIMENVKNPIIIDSNYMAKGAKEPSHVKISNINFKNIRGTASNEALVTLNCSSAVPCTQVKLDTVSLKGPSGKGLTSCQNAKVEMVGTEGIACG